MSRRALELFGSLGTGFVAVAIPGQNNVNINTNAVVTSVETQVGVDYVPYNKVLVNNNMVAATPAPVVCQVQAVNVRSNQNMINANVQNTNHVVDVTFSQDSNNTSQVQSPVIYQAVSPVEVQQIDVVRYNGGSSQFNISDESTGVNMVSEETSNIHVVVSEVAPAPPPRVVQIVSSPPQVQRTDVVVNSQTGSNVQVSVNNNDLNNIAVCNPITSTSFVQVDATANCFVNQPEIVPQMLYERFERQMPVYMNVNQMSTFTSNFADLFVRTNDLQVCLQSAQPTFDARQFVIVRSPTVEDYVRIMPVTEYVQCYRSGYARSASGGSSTSVINNIMHNYGSTFNNICVEKHRGGVRRHRQSRSSHTSRYYPSNERSYYYSSSVPSSYYSRSARGSSGIYSRSHGNIYRAPDAYTRSHRPSSRRQRVQVAPQKTSRPQVEEVIGVEEPSRPTRSSRYRSSRGPSSRRRHAYRG